MRASLIRHIPKVLALFCPLVFHIALADEAGFPDPRLFSANFGFPVEPQASGGLQSPREVWFLGYRLTAPPEKGSAENDQDYFRLHELQDHRTPEDCAQARAQSRLTLESGFGPATGVLTQKQVNESRLLAVAVIAKASIPVIYFKKFFQRPRPYRADSGLSPCISKPGFGDDAYPSGHSTIGYALALVLAKKFPHKRDLILRQGLRIGENRVMGGVHHPSDIIAGRKLAEQVVQGMIRAQAFASEISAKVKSKNGYGTAFR